MKYNVLETIKLETSKGNLELLPGRVVALPNKIAIQLIGEGRIKPYETKGPTYAFEETQVLTGVLAEGRGKELKPISDETLLGIYDKAMDKINVGYIAGTTPYIQEHNKQLYTEINNADDRVNEVWKECNAGEASIETFNSALASYESPYLEAIKLYEEQV